MIHHQDTKSTKVEFGFMDKPETKMFLEILNDFALNPLRFSWCLRASMVLIALGS
jgi:hypothetical protein